MSDVKLKLPDLSRELEDLTWSETVKFGVQLEMEFSVLKKIGEDKTDDLRLLTAMNAWLQSDPNASWKKVVRALRAIRKKVLAQELEEKYCRDGGSEPPAPRDPEFGCTASATAAAVPHSIPPPTAYTRMDQHSSQLTQPGLLATTVSYSIPPPPAAAYTRMDQRSSQLTQPGLLATAVPHSIPAKPRKLTVQCRQKKRAPCNMIRGSAATDGRFVYIAPDGSNSPYQYECSTEEWMELPSCPYRDSGLAIIDSELTTVGGWDGDGRTTNKLFTLRQGKWVEVYPPINTARSCHAVVSTSDGDYLIAIGGDGSDGVTTATVELFHVKSRRWYKLTDLPQPLIQPSATICGDLLHVIGRDCNGYSCSLQSLPSNDRPITSPLTLSWKPLPPLPVELSTAATLCGRLVLIGGLQVLSTVNSIHQLVEGQWVEIGSMTSGRCWCLAVSPSPDRILIVSGDGAIDSVEECVAV